MHQRRYAALIASLILLAALALAASLPAAVTAQDAEVGTPPIVLTPGVPLFGRSTAMPTVPGTTCYEPLPIEIGQVIFIEPGVNIRSAPSGSSAIVWNTIINSRNEDGEVENPIQLIATVIDGPVCDIGTNWWQVVLPGNDGWVSEGRPDAEGGYLINAPGLFADRSCQSYYQMRPGQYADLFLNARVRTAPGTDGRVRTVAPAGTPVLILGGPQCVDAIQWWLVRVEVADFVYEGWMADGDNGLIWLIPDDAPSLEDGTLCNSPLALEAGQRAYVSSKERLPRNMRAAPGLDAPLLYRLIDGVPFIIEGGPICRDNLNWWRIRLLSSGPVIGWMAEGSTGVGYWISTVDPYEFAH